MARVLSELAVFSVVVFAAGGGPGGDVVGVVTSEELGERSLSERKDGSDSIFST